MHHRQNLRWIIYHMGWAQTRTRIFIWCVPPHCHEFTSSKCLSYHTLTHIFVLLNEMKWNEYGKQPTQVHSIHWRAWIRTSSLFDFNDDMSLSIQYTLFWYERQQLKSMTRPTDWLTDWMERNGLEWTSRICNMCERPQCCTIACVFVCWR